MPDFIMLNEPWTNTTIAGYTNEYKEDNLTDTKKINVCIQVRNHVINKRISDLQGPNTLIIKLVHQKIILICTYLRPRESLFNIEVLAHVSHAVESIRLKDPESKILFAADLNRENDATELFLHKLNNITMPPNYNGRNGPSWLSAICTDSECTKVEIIKNSDKLSDHAAIGIQMMIGKFHQRQRFYAPNKRLSNIIQTRLIHDQSWTSLHDDYPSAKRRRMRIKIRNYEDKDRSKMTEIIELIDAADVSSIQSIYQDRYI